MIFYLDFLQTRRLSSQVSSRIEGLPVYEKKNASVPAEIFNLYRLGLKRIENPHTFELSLRDMSMILEEGAWIVADRSMNDLPVMAWTDFQSRGRSLHEPVKCSLLLFHAHAGLVVDTALHDMKMHLEEALHKDRS